MIIIDEILGKEIFINLDEYPMIYIDCDETLNEKEEEEIYKLAEETALNYIVGLDEYD